MASKAPCRFFQLGKCGNGDKCNFAHVVDPNFKRKACQYFAKGKCRNGATCTYSHDRADIEAMKNDPSQLDATTEAKARQWRYNIPRDTSNAKPLGVAANRFWKDALDLVGGDAGLMQDVITLLASEGGMFRIRELLEAPFDKMNNAQLTRFSNNQLLPFSQTITHKNVNTSAILETRLMTIYSYIFGPGGHRMVDEPWITAYGASVTALSRLIEVNTSAQVVPELQPVVETLVGLLPDTSIHFAAKAISAQLSRLQHRLGLGSALQSLESMPAAPSTRATFNLAKERPGELSEAGPRHDNDKVDIRDISILPTEEEIQSSRGEYLPLSDPTEWHLGGLEGLLDRNFRLLREDTVGQLRDAAKFELERLQRSEANANQTHKRQGARTNVYTNVIVENVGFDAQRGLEVVVGFDQPKHLTQVNAATRRDWWQGTKRLGPDSLICLLGTEGSTKFLVVSMETYQSGPKGDNSQNISIQLHKDYNLWRDPNRAHVVARLVNDEVITPLLREMLAEGGNDLSLVEFPGVLLPAFMPTLKAMQRKSDSLDVPFSDILAPVATPTNPERDIDIGLPAYATRPGFSFKLSSITATGADIRFTPGEDIHTFAQTLEEASSLDAAQSVALVSALSRRMALIQGPPGTGKSYTGVELIRVLLANKEEATLGPILCVTFTNHALDQGLERLLDQGVDQVIRIGGRSKSDKLADVNLRTVAQNEELTKTEKKDRWAALKKMQAETKEMNNLLRGLNQIDSQASVAAHLRMFYPDHYRQLFDEVDEDGFEVVNYHRDDIIDHWLHGAPHDENGARQVRELHDINANHMSARERMALYRSWLIEIEDATLEKFAVALAAYKEAKEIDDRIRTERDLRVLRRANIIGVTTSGLAKSLDLLGRLNIKVLLCEEAGEVLEAHLLTALLPTLEHAILIGDHQQLRPHVQNYELSVEKRNGSHHALDISLFERLVQPNNLLGVPIPYCTLEVQRRMHPSISNLIRQTVYPRLQDAEAVSNYPPVSGFKKRLFWLHHEIIEDGGAAELQSTSHTKDYECEMVQAIVSHLVKQGTYRAKDIAVITPYLGQLRKIRKQLARTYQIVLNERDEEQLAKEGNEEPDSGLAPANSDRRKNVARGTLLEALRVATVDNFQGEEAKVIVVSLVRSNINNNPGFLRTTNRINVLLSRAQHGMYILGNVITTRSIPMFAAVHQMLDQNGDVGDTLELQCPRHEHISMPAKQPEDFHRFAPEAGCQLPCDKMLDCGHACTSKCHSYMLHDAVHCTKPCTRPKEGCAHNCPKDCGDICDKECQVIVNDIQVVAECGHVKTSLPCYQYQDPTKIICETLIQDAVPGCGHVVTIPCHLDASDSKYVCTATCGAALPCGHSCTRDCHECRSRSEDNIITATHHGKCRKVCDRNYTTCKHRCTEPCHDEDPCPLCEEKCDVKCSHSACNKKCHEPCTPCAEGKCNSHCPHSACKMPCAAPCDWLPCAQRCTKLLDCGCQCPSVCGEICPSSVFCQNCANEDIKALKADLIMYETYEEIDLDENPCIFTECGHVFTLSSLDGTMEMHKHYDYDKSGECTAIKLPAHVASAEVLPTTDPSSEEAPREEHDGDILKACPHCRGSLRGVARYGRIVRRQLLDQSTKKLTAWSNRTRHGLSERLLADQERLIGSFDDVLKPKQDVLLVGSSNAQIKAVRSLRTKSRYSSIIKTRSAIQKFAERVAREEQPYQRVQDLVETARRQRGQSDIAPFRFDIAGLQLQQHVKAMILLTRCETMIPSDIIGLHTNASGPGEKGRLAIGFDVYRKQCEDIIKEAESSINALQAIEGRILWAKLAAMKCGTFHDRTGEKTDESVQQSDELEETARAMLVTAEEASETLKDLPEGLIEEMNEVKKMLKEGISTSEMRMVVAAMGAEFGSTGHWYRCVNGHLFTVGECGMPMRLARCPDCGQGIGGQNHRPAEGVTRALDIDEQFGALAL